MDLGCLLNNDVLCGHMKKKLILPKANDSLNPLNRSGKSTLGGDSFSDQSAKKLRQMKDPTVGLIIKILICCAVIDLSIVGYFKLIKKEPVLDGVQGWALSIKDLFNNDSVYVLERDPMSKRAMLYSNPEYYKLIKIAKTQKSQPT